MYCGNSQTISSKIKRYYRDDSNREITIDLAMTRGDSMRSIGLSNEDEIIFKQHKHKKKLKLKVSLATTKDTPTKCH